MNHARIRGVGFGTTSGVITTLGLMVGIYFTLSSRLAVIGSILVIAISDAMSDALGIHVSTEAQGKTAENVWSSTVYTFLAKFFTALVFIVPVLFLELRLAVIVNIVLGFLIIGLFSFVVAKSSKEHPVNVIFEHLGISVVVIILSGLVGHFVSVWFG